jgi:hypothetical protein
MLFNFLIRISEHPPKADKSAPTVVRIIVLICIIDPLELFTKAQGFFAFFEFAAQDFA